MIHLVDRTNREMYAEQLNQMWKQRYKIFVELLGWDLKCDEDHEADSFDTEDTVYILALDEAGSVLGSVRLLPSTGPHLMSEVFPDLCENGVPRGDGVWEVSRMYVMPMEGGFERKFEIGSRILCGVIEFGLLFEGETITLVTNIDGVPGLLDVGWDVSPLGLPKETFGETLVALSVAVTSTALANVRSKSNIEGPVMRYSQPATAA